MITSRILGIVVVVASTASARAGTDVVAISGSVAERDLSTVDHAVDATLRGAGWQLPETRPSAQENVAVQACLERDDAAKCAAALHGQAVGRALVVTADRQQGADGGLVVVLTGKLVTFEPAQLVVGQRRCAPCTDDTLTQAASALIHQLLEELAVRGGRTLVAIKSRPSGASIRFDGARIGATPMVARTFPGDHVVELDRAGSTAARREIHVVEGSTSEVAIDLESPPGWWHLPAVLVGGGVVVLWGGAYLVHLGGEDGPEDKYRYSRATPIGVAAIVAGVALGGIGGYLLWRGPSVTVENGGAVVGIAGSF